MLNSCVLLDKLLTLYSILYLLFHVNVIKGVYNNILHNVGCYKGWWVCDCDMLTVLVDIVIPVMLGVCGDYSDRRKFDIFLK